MPYSVTQFHEPLSRDGGRFFGPFFYFENVGNTILKRLILLGVRALLEASVNQNDLRHNFEPWWLLVPVNFELP